MRQIFYAAALAFMASSAQASIEFATCENPAEQIVPADWQPYEADGPVVPVPSFTAGRDGQVARIQKGRLFVDRRIDPIRLSRVDWVRNRHNFVSTQLHGLVGIGGALAGVRERLPAGVEAAIGAHILNWAHCSLYNRDINPRAWHEGTTMKRQSNLLHALNYSREHGQLGPLDLTTLLYLIDANAAFLLDEPDVYARGNHGLRQDMLLAATAISLPEHPRADEMLRLAEDRMAIMAEEFFTDDGIWFEHAPGYVNYAIRLLNDVRRLHRASEDFNPIGLVERIDTSHEYLMSSLRPNGSIPWIGQSGTDRVAPVVARPDAIEEHLAERARTLSAFPGYGHAILRGDHPDGLYLIFVAAQNLPAGKRHADDLSFLIDKFGRPWVTEGGAISNEAGPMTDFLFSAMSHNTYIFNERPARPSGRIRLPTQLTTAEETEAGYLLAGFSERFGARAERDIEVDEDFASIKVTDRLLGDGEWQGRLQIPDDLDVSIDGSTMTATDPETGRQMLLSFSAALPFSTCKGEETPLCGWGLNDDGHGPVTTLMWEAAGSTEIEIDISWR